MSRAATPGWAKRRGPLVSAMLWLGLALLTLTPGALSPVARAYHRLCGPFPALAIVGRLVPPGPLALLLLLAGVVLVAVVASGLRAIIGGVRLARRLSAQTSHLPPCLATVARALGITNQLVYLDTPAPAAFCYGLLAPRIVLTAGLLHRLDDQELTAVLLHERHHAWRRDPLRYLLLDALSAGLFMIPLAAILRQRVEMRIELAADRAALAIVPRGVLAGALAAVLPAPAIRPLGGAALSATEARIAQLVGRSERSPLPVGAALASVGLAAGLAVALVWLSHLHQTWELFCALCPWIA